MTLKNSGGPSAPVMMSRPTSLGGYERDNQARALAKYNFPSLHHLTTEERLLGEIRIERLCMFELGFPYYGKEFDDKMSELVPWTEEELSKAVEWAKSR